MAIKFLGIPVRFSLSSFVLIWLGAMIGIDVSGHAGLLINSIFAVLSASLLIFSILFHERAHIFAASRYGIAAEEVVLVAFGGIARLESTGKTARESFWIAIAGPISSAVIAGTLFGAGSLLRDVFPAANVWTDLLFLYTRINLALALFNLLPIFPMDGGRVLFSALWSLYKEKKPAVRLTIAVGRGCIACALVVAVVLYDRGTLLFFHLVWYGLIALFIWKIQDAALRDRSEEERGDAERPSK